MCPKCKGSKEEPNVEQEICENCMGQMFFILDDGVKKKVRKCEVCNGLGHKIIHFCTLCSG